MDRFGNGYRAVISAAGISTGMIVDEIAEASVASLGSGVGASAH